MYRLLLFMIVAGVLASCASTPAFDISKVDRALTPASVIDDPASSLDKMALWGGTILDTRNLKYVTQIEVLSYPLNSSYRPRLDEKPMGRFIIQHQGYLEPEVFIQGKLLSVVGKVGQSINGRVGDSDYIYPLILSEQMRLWSSRGQGRSHFQFGIGIHLSN